LGPGRHGRRPEDPLHETFEAIVFDWEGAIAPDEEIGASQLRERVELTCATGVHVAIITDSPIDAVDDVLRARPHGEGRLHICCRRGGKVFVVDADGPSPVSAGTGGREAIGLADESDPARWAAGWLTQRGITGGLILVGAGQPVGTIDTAGLGPFTPDAFPRSVAVSVESEPAGTAREVLHLGGGPPRFIELLDEQLARRRVLRVPNIDLDLAWVVPLPATRAEERVAEALGTLGNGLAGVRGSRDEDGPGATPLFLVNGVYTSGGRLLPGPNWAGLERPGIDRRYRDHRLLDLRGGTLVRISSGTGGRSMRFVSATSAHIMALRAEGAAVHLHSADRLGPPTDGTEFESSDDGDMAKARTRQGGVEIAVVARDRVITTPARRDIERLVAWSAGADGPDHVEEARGRLEQGEAVGFDRLLADHRAEWAHRWDDAEVVIEGDPEAELAARFAVFHLLSSAGDVGESAVGARGLTGTAYAGHVFWDADVFVLPVLAAIRPAAARATLDYRIRRLPAARAAARARGMSGARFPWESAGDGRDVTPTSVRGRNNELVPITTGSHEEHIVADVAWAAAHYAAWTGDASFLSGAGRDLVVDTARYWASRVRTDGDGGHLDGVTGPDEYHPVVNDNAFTNVMARWNLRRGAELVAQSGHGDEAEAWRDLADRLIDGWNPERGIYEQFAGYFDLEPLLMAEVGPPPLAVDMVLGAERVAWSQLIKQADVLMLHHLLPSEVARRSLTPCLDFYGPRTAHGSSLSPAIHASLLARAGRPEQALELFRLAARLDLDDVTGTTADGLHLATMGGVWQALAFGFLGLRATEGTLTIDPCLPERWTALSLRICFGGNHLGVRAEQGRVTITCHAPQQIRVGDQAPTWCRSGTTVMPNPPTIRGSRP
jgi:trehalose/maltose hydrolase-like predicted phosphorylase